MRQADVEITVDELLDREKIRHNLARYSRGMDRQDVELLSSTYWPEGWDDHGMIEATGRDFAYSMTKMWPTLKMGHMLGQVYIELHGTLANVESYFFAYHRIGEVGNTKDIHLGGRYNDRLEKRGSSWKFIHRVAVYDWWRDAGRSEPWDGKWQNDEGWVENLPSRSYGATENDYSWELFANTPIRKAAEYGPRKTPL